MSLSTLTVKEGPQWHRTPNAPTVSRFTRVTVGFDRQPGSPTVSLVKGNLNGFARQCNMSFFVLFVTATDLSKDLTDKLRTEGSSRQASKGGLLKIQEERATLKKSSV